MSLPNESADERYRLSIGETVVTVRAPETGRKHMRDRVLVHYDSPRPREEGVIYIRREDGVLQTLERLEQMPPYFSIEKINPQAFFLRNPDELIWLVSAFLDIGSPIVDAETFRFLEVDLQVNIEEFLPIVNSETIRFAVHQSSGYADCDRLILVDVNLATLQYSTKIVKQVGSQCEKLPGIPP